MQTLRKHKSIPTLTRRNNEFFFELFMILQACLENRFEEIKHFTILKVFSSDTPQSIKRQNKGPKEHDEKYIPSCGYHLF